MQETTLIFARAQMEVSLAFHMVFAALGIGMPLLMVLAEARYVLGHGEHFRDLARTWGKATALLFAIGAVSGTALSFELGLLWPKLMWLAGPSIGPAFVVEGYAFFLEAIFVGLYLYGWGRLTPKQHLAVGIPVAVSGLVSGILVVAANAWMQKPAAFTLGPDGAAIPTSSFTAFSSPMWAPMSVHSSLACYASVGFAVAGVYAAALRLRGRGAGDASRHRSTEYLRAGFRLALAVGATAAVCQAVSGDASARIVAREEPVKLAAMEAHFVTADHAPLLVGGWADASARTIKGAIPIPGALSFLAKGDFSSEVSGLEITPPANWPNVARVHLAFDLMVGCGSVLALVAALFAFDRFRARRHRERVEPRWFVTLVLLVSPLGFTALEAGWFVTEAGRQPWAVQGLLRVADAVTTAPGVPVVFAGFAALYLLLAVALIGLLRALAAGHDHAPGTAAGAGAARGGDAHVTG